jgi:hypothetical protein
MFHTEVIGYEDLICSILISYFLSDVIKYSWMPWSQSASITAVGLHSASNPSKWVQAEACARDIALLLRRQYLYTGHPQTSYHSCKWVFSESLQWGTSSRLRRWWHILQIHCLSSQKVSWKGYESVSSIFPMSVIAEQIFWNCDI